MSERGYELRFKRIQNYYKMICYYNGRIQLDFPFKTQYKNVRKKTNQEVLHCDIGIQTNIILYKYKKTTYMN